MAYIPKAAERSLADLGVEIRVVRSGRNVFRINTVLIKPATPEEAHSRAKGRGEIASRSFTDPAGNQVIIPFMGLRHLEAIHASLEDALSGMI